VTNPSSQMLRLTPSTLEMPVVDEPTQMDGGVKVGYFGVASIEAKGRGRGKKTSRIQRFVCIVQKIVDEDYEVEYLEATSDKKFHSHHPKEVAWIEKKNVEILHECPSLDHRGHYTFEEAPV
jgi:hypothetical protein